MKRRLHICIVLLFLGFQFSHAQDPNVVGGKSSVKMDFKKTSVKTKKTLNEAKKTVSPLDNKISLDNSSAKSNASTEAGSTAGSLSVSLTGAASYSIPVMVPQE